MPTTLYSVTSAAFQLNEHFVLSGGSAVTASPAYSGVSLGSVVGTDEAGHATFSITATPAVGPQVDFTFATAYTTAPNVFLTPATASSNLNYYATSTTTGFVVGGTMLPVVSGTYSFNYLVTG